MPLSILGLIAGTLAALTVIALRLPNNSLRVLAAFAMEVLLMEYSVAGFAPVILATVSATTLARAVFGNDLAYNVPSLSPGALSELPYILVCGVLIGLLAAGFSALFQWVSVQGGKLPTWLRPMLAGLLIGVCGAMVPEVMGIDDDTVNHILRGEGLTHASR